MSGRSLLPFGDTFAVLMVVFLVLSLSVGRYPSVREGAAVREPVLVVIGSGDPFEIEAEALVGFSSNVDGVDYRHSGATRTGNAERVIAFLQGALADAEIIAQFSNVGFGTIEPAIQLPANTPRYEEFIESLRNDTPDTEFLRNFHYSSPGEDGRFPRVRFGSLESDLYALTDTCQPFHAEATNRGLLGNVDLTTTGFGSPGDMRKSVSLSLDGARTDTVTLVGLFVAIPLRADPEIVIDRMAYSPAMCRGFEGLAVETLDPHTFLDTSAPCGRFVSRLEDQHSRAVNRPGGLGGFGGFGPGGLGGFGGFGSGGFEPPLTTEILRPPEVVLRPIEPEARRRLGELVYHWLYPRPVDIRVFEANGNERYFRTPTWWEMFRTGRGVSPNHAWTVSSTECNSLASAFMAGDADEEAVLFSFRMTIGPDGDIDHHGTLIDLSERTTP